MKKAPKIIIDTNIFVSSLLGSRTCKFICDLFENQKFLLVISKPLVKEIREVLKDKSLGKISEEDIENLFKTISINAEVVSPSIKLNICRDQTDNKILEAALEAKADFVVTGDKDLLSLKTFSIPIISPKEFASTFNE